MVFEHDGRGDQYRRNHFAKLAAPANSNKVIVGLLLCFVMIMVWLVWPSADEKTTEPDSIHAAEEQPIENTTIPANLFANSKVESRDSANHPQFPDTRNPTANAILAQKEGDLSKEQATMNAVAGSGQEIDEEPLRLPISGWVLDQDGEPVAGLGVSASSRRLARDGSASVPEGQSAETVTDTGGYFAFGDLRDGEYLLQTESTDIYESATSTVRTGVSSIVLRVAEERRRPVMIYGAVTEDDSQPIAGVRVAPTDESRTTTTDDTGVYGLELTVDERPRTRSIRFTKAGYRDQTLRVRHSDLRELTEWRLDAELKKDDGVTVDGTVTDVEGTPVPGARVQMYSYSLGRSHQATSRQDGSFDLQNVEMADDYRLWVRPKADFQDHVEEGYRVGRNGLYVPVVLEPLDKSSLRGRMVNASSAPISQYTLWMWNSGAGANPNLAVTSDLSGYFLVEDIPAGEVVFGSRGYPQFTIGGIRLEAGKTMTANLVLDWGSEEMVGQLVNSESGQPVAGADVSLFWTNDEHGVTSHSRRQTIADGNGHFIFTELGPGLHTINVNARGFIPVRRDAVPGEGIVVELQQAAP